MPGHMLPPPGSSGTETDGEGGAAAGQPPPMTATTNEDNSGDAGDEAQANGRGKKRTPALAANSRNDQSKWHPTCRCKVIDRNRFVIITYHIYHEIADASKRAGKRAVVNGTDSGATSTLTGATGDA